MSELKAFDIVVAEEGYFTGVVKYRKACYDKSEADKVIAEKDKEIETQKRLRDMALASVPNVLKVMKIIQHHKYKRCLAMAGWCRARYSLWPICFSTAPTRKMKFLDKWEKRWLGLAEKFKEA